MLHFFDFVALRDDAGMMHDRRSDPRPILKSPHPPSLTAMAFPINQSRPLILAYSVSLGNTILLLAAAMQIMPSFSAS